MKSCLLTSCMNCCSLEAGLVAIVLLDFILCIVIAIILLLNLDSFVVAIKNFEYEDLKEITIFCVFIFALFFAILRFVFGVCLLYYKEKCLTFKLYFYLVLAADVLSILSIVLQLSFGSTKSVDFIIFASILGATVLYYFYCILILYSYWESIQLVPDPDPSSPSKESALSKLQGKVKKIVEDVGLSVIPELSERNEVSSHFKW